MRSRSHGLQGGRARGGSHGKLIHVRPPEKDRPLFTQAGNDGGVIRGAVTRENARGAGAGLPLDAQGILHGNRDA